MTDAPPYCNAHADGDARVRDLLARMRSTSAAAAPPSSPGRQASTSNTGERPADEVGHLAFHDPEMALVVEPGAVEFLVAVSSADVRARATFEITGPRRLLRRDEIRPTQASVR